eukprot:4521851-Pleurochrysis_carterae.AAC.1
MYLITLLQRDKVTIPLAVEIFDLGDLSLLLLLVVVLLVVRVKVVLVIASPRSSRGSSGTDGGGKHGAQTWYRRVQYVRRTFQKRSSSLPPHSPLSKAHEPRSAAHVDVDTPPGLATSGPTCARLADSGTHGCPSVSKPKIRCTADLHE